MSISQKAHTELNPFQVSLLRLFNRSMSEKETMLLKDHIIAYYSEQLNEEISEVLIEKGYTQKGFDAMLNGTEE